MQRLKQTEASYWMFTVLYSTLFIFLFWAVLSFNFRYTYQLPLSSPGTLVSDRWTFNYVREWLLFVYWLVPLSGLFMIMMRTRFSVNTHLVVALILFGWFVVMMTFDVIQLTRRNLDPTHKHFDTTNMANDARWCCVFGGQPGTELICCLNTTIAACPPITQAQLGINGPFLLRFIVHILLGACIIYDFLHTWTVYSPRLEEFYSNRKNNNAQLKSLLR